MGEPVCFFCLFVRRFFFSNDTSSLGFGFFQLMIGLVQPEEEKAARGPNIYLQISAGWVSGGRGQTLSSGAQ